MGVFGKNVTMCVFCVRIMVTAAYMHSVAMYLYLLHSVKSKMKLLLVPKTCSVHILNIMSVYEMVSSILQYCQMMT